MWGRVAVGSAAGQPSVIEPFVWMVAGCIGAKRGWQVWLLSIRIRMQQLDARLLGGNTNTVSNTKMLLTE